MNFSKTEKIIAELDGGWLDIWFNSPENRNALGAQLSEEFTQVLHAVRDDRSVRGITLRGKGGIFCAGGDLKSFGSAQGAAASHADIAKMNRDGGEMFALLQSMPQVVIACVEGAAIAGGLGLMCCADIAIVTKDAKFALTETMLGIVPAQIVPIVTARIGVPAARRLMLTAARFTGDDAKDIGLCDYVADDESGFDPIISEIKAGVMKCAPGAIGITKDILLKSPHLAHEEMMDYAAQGFASALLSDEGKEGITSFIEKRKPSWTRQRLDRHDQS